MKATIYARQSLDRTGEGLAVSRQLDLCRELCEQRGWTVAAELVDNDRSATSGVSRPAFEALLSSRPETIVVWHIDRLCRLTKDLERVIELGADVYAVKAGQVDLSSPAGRAVARTVVIWATYEGEQKADRQKAANEQRAKAGKPSAGRRCYGYTGSGLEIVEAEAYHLRRAVEGILAGMSLRAVVRRMTEEGAVTTTGRPWRPTELRRTLARPRLVAQRVHLGQVVAKGEWPAILTDAEQSSVMAIFSDPSRRPLGRPRAYLLSGVASCGACGGKIYGRQDSGGPIYVCQDHAHLGRKIGPVDEFVEEVIVARLSLPDAAQTLARPDGSDRAAELRSKERVLVDRLDDLAKIFGSGHIDRRQLITSTKEIKAQLDAIAAEMPSVEASPIGGLVSAVDVEAAWLGLDVETRRRVIGLLMEVVIHPAGRGARRFDPETVRLTWRS